MKVKMLVRQIRPLNQTIKKYDQELARLFADHPDAPIFDSFPGAGPVLAPRLLAAFGSDRSRYTRPNDIQTYSGIAPVIERSGKQCWIHWRWHCPKFLRQSFHEYAKCSLLTSTWAKAYYDLQIERGKEHHAAIRALAFKWIRIMFRCWQDRALYNEERYLESLKKRGSALWQRIAAAQQQAA